MAPDATQRSEVVGGLIAALVGGAIGWIIALTALGLWGLVIGLLVTATVLVALARRHRARRALGAMAGFAFAFILLTWPVLWLLVAYIRAVVTGEPAGD